MSIEFCEEHGGVFSVRGDGIRFFVERDHVVFLPDGWVECHVGHVEVRPGDLDYVTSVAVPRPEPTRSEITYIKTSIDRLRLSSQPVPKKLEILRSLHTFVLDQIKMLEPT